MGSNKSNTNMVQYNNTTINAGGNIYLTTQGNATFSGANVEGNQLIFDIAGYLVRRSTKC